MLLLTLRAEDAGAHGPAAQVDDDAVLEQGGHSRHRPGLDVRRAEVLHRVRAQRQRPAVRLLLSPRAHHQVVAHLQVLRVG